MNGGQPLELSPATVRTVGVGVGSGFAGMLLVWLLSGHNASDFLVDARVVSELERRLDSIEQKGLKFDEQQASLLLLRAKMEENSSAITDMRANLNSNMAVIRSQLRDIEVNSAKTSTSLLSIKERMLN